MGKLPIIKVKDIGVSAAIFCENVENRKTGEIYPTYTFAIQRSYKDKKTGDYVNQTINAYSDEVLPLANVIIHAYNKLLDYKIEDQASRQANESTKKEANKASRAASVDDDDIPF